MADTSTGNGSGGERTAEEASSRDTLDDLCAYSIVVRTSSDQNASTDGSVFIQLTDKEGNRTSKCRLNCSISHRRKFQRAHSDLFVLTEQNLLAELKTVDVWLKSRHSDGASWKLHSVNVIEHASNLLYRFPCNKWLSDESEDSAHVQIEATGLPFKVLRDEFFDVQK
uniref:PLAT domain-containing protein n=1 Tax=Panagrellus redivivus TaxID=6233 RepID=A0A7E4W424_PANRE